jgi:hypothetical protein
MDTFLAIFCTKITKADGVFVVKVVVVAVVVVVVEEVVDLVVVDFIVVVPYTKHKFHQY